MVEIKANLSVQIPGGPQINAAQILKLESYQYFDLNLDKDHFQGVVTLNDLKKSSLILMKATLTLEKKDSKTALICTIGDAGTPFALDAPFLLLGSCIASLAKDAGKITFKLDPTPTNGDTAKLEIITGWQDIDTPPA